MHEPAEQDHLEGLGDECGLRVSGWHHTHSGHCESGVASSLLSYHGLPLSEAMAFGLSSSLIFCHFPWIRVEGQPLTAYRGVPGSVLKNLERNLGLVIRRQRFRDREQAQQQLTARLAAGQPVGLQTSVFWLPYFPPEMRFHFNAHNLVAVGRDRRGDFIVSDPVFEHLQHCDPVSLEQARFARGLFAPRGLMYWVERTPRAVDWEQALRRAIRKTVRINLRTPLPIVGIRAITRLARKVRKMAEPPPVATSTDATSHRSQQLFIGQIVRMQEEIGTGGGGFRFMYAAFLQEAAALIGDAQLTEAAQSAIAAGDQWRSFALAGAGFCKGNPEIDLEQVADRLDECVDREQRLFVQLADWLRR
ncbi:hypothetical protein CKO15_10240 [Halorhodospira abdelmalekii]|uniref:BtrH N-terminal domain-containing protein n=1 Tax=Halorhodospira abdelmalekii TaxID=421629 RepID=UPI001905D5EC|nr:BtrH N-terminal domain-containing protein [Halorhodospira abdelmalekii]MBK1735655.1 hypothetical protein [Halorhodospira abdelmalekii]